jgi:membrane protein implicated in regulation of membrane protease activity
VDEAVIPGAVWIAAGLVLLALEMFAPGAFMMWLGLAAIGTGIAELATDIGFEAQVVVFAVLAAAAIGVGLALRGKPKPPVLNTETSGLVGRSAVALSFRGREGRVRVGDSDWAARVPAGMDAPDPGALLEVTGVAGTVVEVRPKVES